MHLLGLDIGTKRTGVAFADTNAGFVMAMDTLHHATTEELCSLVDSIVQVKKVEELIIGLPRLLDGTEGLQAERVRETAAALQSTLHLPITYIDERFTSANANKDFADAKAACSILEVVVSQRKKIY